MNAAAKSSIATIESVLDSHGSYRRIDERLYVIKQGSTYVMINVVPFGDKAVVRCSAQLVKGVDMSTELAIDLLKLNGQLRFGAFAFDPYDDLVSFQHSILGGPTMDASELLATLTDVALIADEYDDKIIAKYGGRTMRDLLEEAAMERILEADPDSFSFGEA